MSNIQLEQSPTPGDEVITNYTINFGPQHPAAHGVLRMVMELDGEIIRKAIPVAGYLHRGIEKIAEHRTYHQIIPLTDRLNYCSALMNNIGYVKAVESWLGLEEGNASLRPYLGSTPRRLS